VHIDTSAVVALLALEPDAERIAAAVQRADTVGLCATVRLEAVMALTRELQVEPEVAGTLVQRFIERSGAYEIAVDSVVAGMAVAAFARYGKGRNSRARLNFGDCCVYAAARLAGQPLLFLGSDFIQTDLLSVLEDPRPLRR
jgi:ribonuclease VapC